MYVTATIATPRRLTTNSRSRVYFLGNPINHPANSPGVVLALRTSRALMPTPTYLLEWWPWHRCADDSWAAPGSTGWWRGCTAPRSSAVHGRRNLPWRRWNHSAAPHWRSICIQIVTCMSRLICMVSIHMNNVLQYFIYYFLSGVCL